MAGSVLKILRSGTLGSRPTGRVYGEPYVNLAENQLGVINSSGAAQDLLGVPIFSTTNTYTAGQPVNHGGGLFLALGSVPAGAWNPAQWTPVASQSYVAGQIPSSPIPSGTVMAFWQAAAPTGWTQVTTQNDKLLRVVSGTGGVSGGTNSFSSIMAQTTTGNHTLARAELPSIPSSGSNNVTVYPQGNSGIGVPFSAGGWNVAIGGISATGGTQNYYAYAPNGSISYTASFSGGNVTNVTSSGTSGTAHTHPITLDIQYIDLILASKN